MVGVLYLVLGSLQVGFTCNLLSGPIISAFLTAGPSSSALPRWEHILLQRLQY